MYTAVIVGIVEIALETARQQLERKRASMRAYEQVEWSKIVQEGWLIQQGYEGMLRAVEEEKDRVYTTLVGKTAIAELAESVLLRYEQGSGRGGRSRHAPFGFWLEDVRALGFLRASLGACV